MAKSSTQSPLQKLADSSSQKRAIAIQLENLHSQAIQELAAAETKFNLATEASFASSEYFKKTKTNDKNIKGNLAYRFPAVRQKYAILLASAEKQLALTKSDMSSAKSALVTLTRKVQGAKKKSISANKIADDAEKKFKDVAAAAEKEAAVVEEAPSIKDDEAVKAAAVSIGASQRKQSSNLFRSIERTRDKAIDPTLERHILGDTGAGARMGVRSGAEEFARQNSDLFRGDGLEATAARQMLEEAVILAESSLKSSPEDAGKILGRLKYLEKVATDAGDDIVGKKILDIIKPVKAALSKKASFSSLLKKGIGDHIEGFKTHMIKNLPLVGNMLEGIRQKKKDDAANTKDYRDSINERISRGGQRGGSLDFREKRGGDGGISDIMRGMGASPASESGMLSGIGSKSPIYEILKKTYEKIVSIYDLLHEYIDPEESALTNRENEFESRRGIGKKAQSSISSVSGGGGGILDGIINTVMSLGGAAIGGAGIGAAAAGGRAGLNKTLIGNKLAPIGKYLGFGGGAKGVGAVIPRGTGAPNPYDLVPDHPPRTPPISAPKSGFFSRVGGMFSNTWSGAKGMASRGVNSLAAMGKGAFKTAVLKLGSFAKILKPLLGKIPLLGTAIQGIMTAIDISSIKADPNTSPTEKKNKIGSAIGGGLGGLLGTIGGGALGTLIPIPGIGTLLGAVGGGMVGNWLGEMVAESIGGEGIYDMMSEIPGIGSLIHVDDVAKESDLNMEQIMERTKGMPPMDATNPINGSITPSASSPVGSLNNQAASERNSLADMRSGGGQNLVGGNQTSNNQVNNVSNSTTNIHVSEGTRNTEPTVKQMQREMY